MPADVIQEVFTHLEVPDILALSQVRSPCLIALARFFSLVFLLFLSHTILLLIPSYNTLLPSAYSLYPSTPIKLD